MESQCKCRKRQVCEKDYIWKPATCSCKNGWFSGYENLRLVKF